MPVAKKVAVKPVARTAKKPVATVTEVEVTLDFKRETSNYYVYEEAKGGTTTGSLYFGKDVFGGEQPKSLTVLATPNY
jgi:hypothetical protein